MRLHALVGGLLACATATAGAQRPDTTSKPDTLARRDSAAIADSIARADSIFFAGQLGPANAPSGQPAAPSGGARGPINPRLLPDISVVGDLVGDLSPDGSTQEDGARFGIREIEVALQANVDPYFRGDVFLGFNDVEGVAVEQAFLTATALPHGIEARLGRFLMPVSKQNTTHRHDLHTIEYPYVLQAFLGDEGLTGTGISVSKIFAPFGFYQELQLTAVDRFGEASEDFETAEAVNHHLGGLGFSARLRNYWDLTQAANIELSASAVTGEREQPFECVVQPASGEPAPCGFAGPLGEIAPERRGVAARQTTAGLDLTYRWKPLREGLYESFILQAEWLRQFNRAPGDLPDPLTPAPGDVATRTYLGPTRDYDGAYAFARYQLTRRLYVGSRYDWLEDPSADGATLQALSGYLEWFPSEFSKLMAGYERAMPDAPGAEALNRILLQATFALGPHKPHPF